MRQYLSSLILVAWGVACGGSTGSDEPGSAGSSAGGSASAGSNHGGSATAGTANTAGKASGGSGSGGSSGSSSGGSSGSSGGSSSGGNISLAGSGGAIVTAGTGSGGTGLVNPDCPARVPMGACSADVNVSCQYDLSTGCLCFPTPPGMYLPCQKVDLTCTYKPAPAAAPLPDAGVGGGSTKVPLPPHQVCRCTAPTWTCSFGI